MPHHWFQKYPRLTLWLVIIILPLLMLSILELTLWLFLAVPSLNNYFPYFKTTVVDVYFAHDRNILQFMTCCSRYDSELTYTLNPGEFDFCNREYCNRYAVNSAGLRDDEASLRQPDIIALGDSYTVGWGVQQHETFAHRLEVLSGLKVLNAGGSSYGTAREMRLLNRLDTSRMKWLVIQYNNNDFEENEAFVSSGFKLNITPREDYEAECRRHAGRKRCTPFLLTSVFLRINIAERFFMDKTPSAASLLQLRASLQPSADLKFTHRQANSTARDSAKIFLDILSTRNLSGVHLIVVNLSHYTLDTHSFIQKVMALKDTGNYPSFVQNLQVIDASSFLAKEDFYIIDDHLRPSGHRKVAEAIEKIVKGMH